MGDNFKMATVRVVVISDVHIGIYNNFAKPVEGDTLNDRSLASIKPLEMALAEARELDKFLIVDGDLFDQRASLDVRLVNRVASVFKEYQDIAIMLLAGNHDQIDNSAIPENSLEWLATAFPANVSVIKEPAAIQHIYDSEFTFFMVPYSEDVKTTKQKIKEFATETDNAILFAHLGVEGASDGGLYTHRLGGAFGLGDLYPDKFKAVILGHYHKRQYLADNVWYVGSPNQKSFSDENQAKGYDILTLHDDSFTDEFIDLSTDFPKFLTIDSENGLTEANLKQMKDNYVRVVAHNKDELKQFQEANTSNADIVLKEKVKEKKRLDVDKTDTSAQIVSKYTKKYAPEAEQYALEALEEISAED